MIIYPELSTKANIHYFFFYFPDAIKCYLSPSKNLAQQTLSLNLNSRSLFLYPSAICQFRLTGLVQLKSPSENNSPSRCYL